MTVTDYIQGEKNPQNSSFCLVMLIFTWPIVKCGRSNVTKLLEHILQCIFIYYLGCLCSSILGPRSWSLVLIPWSFSPQPTSCQPSPLKMLQKQIHELKHINFSRLYLFEIKTYLFKIFEKLFRRTMVSKINGVQALWCPK